MRERALFARARIVVGMDEVGRGALAGPVCVGAVAVVPGTLPPPPGLDDSKALTSARRTRLVPLIHAWASASALGWATASEVDRLGIVGALRAAGWRALTVLADAGVEARAAIVLLDGRHDWLTPSPVTLAEANQPERARWRTETLVGADRLAASVAAASVVAKCARDGAMAVLDGRYPGYGWAQNMGYGTARHRAAIAALGACEEHRRTWKLVEA
ncbi:MAG: ribonuclease HII [Bifidobacteriaceae bacterium]|nr:ribonuclease HII [Bifidobacteriaceae bacterium]